MSLLEMFSYPFMQRALAAGCTTDRLVETVKKAREKVQVPMVFLTYLNPIFTYGKERFMERCRECGIQGVIVPDMPFEEKGELREVCREYGVEIISLIAPTSHERITAIAKEAEGYIYCVSSLGVTGMRKEISTDIQGMVDKVHHVTKVPCAVGFGISTPEQAQKMAAMPAVEQTLGLVGNLAAVYPEILDNINADEAIRLAADIKGTPEKMMRSEEEVEELRRQRAEAQQQQMQAQQMAAMAQPAKDMAEAARLMSETPTNGTGNALADLLGGAV